MTLRTNHNVKCLTLRGGAFSSASATKVLHQTREAAAVWGSDRHVCANCQPVKRSGDVCCYSMMGAAWPLTYRFMIAFIPIGQKFVRHVSRPERQAASPGCSHLCQPGSAAGPVRGQSAGAQAVQRILDVVLQLKLLPTLLGLRRNTGLSLVVNTETCLR